MHQKLNINKRIASDWFDLNYLVDFPDTDDKIKNLVSEQRYKIRDVNLSSRILNHWYEFGIITDDRPDGKGWKKFSLSEIVWIEIIQKLRKFGFNLNQIKTAKNEISVFNFDKDYPHLNLIEFYILTALQFKTPIKVMIFESGQTEILRQVDIDIAQELECFVEDYISIDLNQILARILNKKELRPRYFNYNSTQKSEIILEIENAIKNKDLFSLRINVKNKEYVIDEELLFKRKEDAIKILDTLQFVDMKVQKREGQSIFTVTKKNKIKRETPNS